MLLAEATSPWLVIGPALIAGTIGLIAAALSYRSAQLSLSHSAEADRDRQNHEYDLLVLERRLNAIEIIWQALFEMERSQRFSDSARDEVVRAVVWLPEVAGQQVLKVVADFNNRDPLRSGIESLREILLSLTKTKEEQGSHGSPEA
jgi:hypothetical protein